MTLHREKTRGGEIHAKGIAWRSGGFHFETIATKFERRGNESIARARGIYLVGIMANTMNWTMDSTVFAQTAV